MTIAWNPGMATGAAVVDAEHRRLIARFNALLAAVESGAEPAAVEVSLRAASNVAIRHFSRDEDCTLRDRCPALLANGAARSEYLGIIASFRHGFERSGPSWEVAAALERDLTAWVDRHIPGQDAEARPCVTGA